MIKVLNAEIELRVIEELVKNYNEHFKNERQDQGRNSTDGILDTIGKLVDSVQDEVKHLISADSDTKIFIRSLTKLISILTSERYNAIEKIKKVRRIVIEATLKI